MKKFRVGISFVLLVVLSIITKNFILLANYNLALYLHEMGHVIVANKRGYTLKILNLDMFGMSVKLNEEVDDRDSFAVNIAGPVVNLLISLVCLAMYTIVPSSVKYLSVFCYCNIVLAIFNLIPIYPLDGGKIFKNSIKSKKVYKILDFLVRFVFVVISLIFIFVMKSPKIVLLLPIILFFLFTSKKTSSNFTLFKNKKTKSHEGVDIVKIDGNMRIFEVVKMINKKKFLIFYCKDVKNHYFDEDMLIDIAKIYPIDAEIKDVIK